MQGFKYFYLILGVAPSAAPEVVRAAYRALAQRHHPDRNATSAAQNGDMMALLNQAYAVLSCPQRRYEYDQQLRRQTYSSSHRMSAASAAHATSSRYPAAVLTTYDHRGRLHAYA